MPRTARAVQAGVIYHVLNRGNGRARLFHDDDQFAAFERILAQGLSRYAVDLLSYCLMGNHWHLVLRPRTAAALPRFMGWLGVTHVRRHYARHLVGAGGGGHLYQGRYKSFPVQADDEPHLLTLLRYVEGNALRAGLVRRAQDWRWSALHARGRKEVPMRLTDWPVDRPHDWVAIVNELLPQAQLEEVRTSLRRGRPFGTRQWVERTARRLGLEFTLRGRGRPKKAKIRN